jgi:thiol-disulfide isomerase/thioredoxin
VGQANQPAPPPPVAKGAPKPPVTTGNVTAADLLDQARQTVAGDPGGALKLIEQAIAKEPQNADALIMAVQLTQNHGIQLARTDPDAGYNLMKKSAGFLRALKKLNVGMGDINSNLESTVYYNEACALAREGKKDEAIASLKECAAIGFDNADLFDTDEDLNPLRQMPAFKDVAGKIKEKAVVFAKEKAKAVIDKTTPFDFDFKLPSIDGRNVSLSEFAGKVLIVDFWGTWCPPCRKEIPHFVALHKKYRAKGLEIVGINYEREKDADKIKKLVKGFADANGISYPCVIGDEVTQSRVPNLEGFPTTLFIDRTGKVRAKLVGYNGMADLETLVTTLLDEPAPNKK